MGSTQSTWGLPSQVCHNLRSFLKNWPSNFKMSNKMFSAFFLIVLAFESVKTGQTDPGNCWKKATKLSEATVTPTNPSTGQMACSNSHACGWKVEKSKQDWESIGCIAEDEKDGCKKDSTIGWKFYCSDPDYCKPVVGKPVEKNGCEAFTDKGANGDNGGSSTARFASLLSSIIIPLTTTVRLLNGQIP